MQAFSVPWFHALPALGMGKIGKGKKQLGIVLDRSLAKIIEERASVLGLTPTRYAAMVVELWASKGYAPVSEPDKLMQLAKK